jgi:DNA replication protein
VRTFSGFHANQTHASAITEQFFTELLPLIDDLVELKVTLACLRHFDQKPGLAQWTTEEELAGDPSLADVQANVAAGLSQAVQRGSIVRAADTSGQTWFFPNSEIGRAAASAVARGESIESIGLLPERPNIYTLYEQSIGALTPIIVDQLRDAEREFPASWIEEAFAEAVKHNVRAWAYVRKILDNRLRRDKRDEARGRDVAADWQRILGGGKKQIKRK